MTDLPANLRAVDWRATTFAGARREQLERWSRQSLVEAIAALEEMERLSAAWETPGPADAASGERRPPE